MTATTTRQGVPARSAAARPKRGTLNTLRRTRVILAIGAVLFGAIGAVTVQSRSDGAQDALKHSGELAEQATTLYQKLSDADATAATIYLHTGPPPVGQIKQYEDDLKAAGDALTALTAEAHGAADTKAAIKTIAEELPTYVEEMGYARSISTYGFPLGTRYLVNASLLMQQGDPTVPGDKGILAAANNLVVTESANLVAAQDQASAFPFVEAGAAAVLLAALLYAQIAEKNRTRRVLNLGLVGATAGLVLSALWLGAAFGVQNGQISLAKKNGSAQIAALSSAQVQSLKARTDEMLTLVGRGTANDKEVDYQHVEPALATLLKSADQQATDTSGDQLARKAINDATAWNLAHTKLRDADNKNDYGAAVASALGDPPNDSTTADAAFQALQDDLDKAIQHAQAGFQKHSQSAYDAVTGAAIGMALLALLMAGAIVAGRGRRISEYQ
jgi:hypothetical protein